MNEINDTWAEWSKHVLKELERLNQTYQSLSVQVADIKIQGISADKLSDSISEIKEWKTRCEDVASVSDLKDAMRDIQELKTFKVQAITVWLMVQLFTAVGIFILKTAKIL